MDSKLHLFTRNKRSSNSRESICSTRYTIKALQSLYDKPYALLKKEEKVYRVLINKKLLDISTDRLKSAYTIDKHRQELQQPKTKALNRKLAMDK